MDCIFFPALVFPTFEASNNYIDEYYFLIKKGGLINVLQSGLVIEIFLERIQFLVIYLV
jgi:hypothetical protein